jgi:uncharacterized protein
VSELTPVAPRERVVTLDVLRSFSLCGVLIGNMALYSGRWMMRSKPPAPTTLDTVADWGIAFFVESKAQTLLTLLFGFGFAVQLLRAQQRGKPIMGLYVRRLVVLFALGVLHISLLWWGDVTWTYAIAGFGLLAFLRTSNRTRVVWGVIFTLVPVLVWTLPAVQQAVTSLFFEKGEFAVYVERIAAAIRRPEHTGLAWEHIRYALAWSTLLFWYFLWVLGRFLLGYVAGKLRWFANDGANHLAIFRRLLCWGVAAAAGSTTLYVLERVRVIRVSQLAQPARLGLEAVEQVRILALALAYVAIIVLLIQRPAWRRVLRILAPAGRMPLTVYFSQSLICTFLFYGWGLGWAGSVGVAGCLGLAVAIFAVQVAACHVWLRWFQFGPLEWIWRSMIYVKLQPMR